MEETERTIGRSESDRTFLRKWLLFVLPLGTLATVFCRYRIDLPIAKWCWMRHYEAFDLKYPKFVEELLVLIEQFGADLGVAIVVVLILELDRSRWIRIFRYLTSIFGAGMTVGLIKLFVLRRRPQGFRFFDAELVGQHNVISIDWTPWTSAFKSVEHGFPSGHTATAFAAFVVLAFFYPKGKRVFFVLAFLVGVQRILCCAHFPSDVIVGAMIGLFIGGACTAFGPLPKFFNHLENTSKKPSQRRWDGKYSLFL